MTLVSDLLAAGAGKAQGSVSDMSAALNQSALVAKNTGLSIDDTTGALAAFASNGLLGSDAGTSFKTMLQSLNPRSEKAASLMKELGLEAYDSQGNFVGLTEYAGQLQTALSGMSQEQRNAALQTIFGSDAIRAATVLYEQGADGMQEWINKVNDSGYAAETAAAKQDNLSGDLEKLGGAFDTLMISMGEGANGPLRLITQGLTGLVDGMNALPGPVKQGALVIGGLTAAVALAGGAYMVAIPKIAAFKAAQDTLNGSFLTGVTSSERFKTALSALGKTAGYTAALGTYMSVANGIAEAMDGAAASTEELTNKLSTGSISDALDTAFEGTNRATNGIVDLSGAFEELGGSWDTRWAGTFYGFVDWLDGSTTNTDALRDALNNLVDGLAALPLADAQSKMKELQETYGLSDEAMIAAINSTGAFKDTLTEVATNAGKTADDQTLLNIALGRGEWAAATEGASGNADALGEVQSSAEATETAIDDLKEAIENFGKATLDSRAAQRDFEQALDDAQDALKENGRTLDISTEAGRKNQAALDDIASSSSNLAQAKLDEGGTIEDVAAIVASGRQRYIDMAVAMGMSGEEAEALADKVIVGADQMTAATKTLDNAKIEDKGFTVSDGGTLAETHANIDALNALGLPDKKLMINADATDAFSQIEGVQVTQIDAKTAVVTGNTEDAWRRIDEVNAKQVPGKTAWVWANDGDFWAKYNAIKNTPQIEKTVAFKAMITSINNGTSGAPFARNATGNLLEYYAAGGLRPMSASVAAMVPANTWRVIGDRAKGDEAFIPIDGSARSWQILQETNRRMSMFADGAVAQYGGGRASGQGGTVIEFTYVAPENSQIRDQEQLLKAGRMLGAFAHGRF